VHNVDTIDRKLSTTTGNLIVHRVIAATFPMPRVLKAMGLPSLTYTLETTVVNPRTKVMVCRSRNLSGTSFLSFDEVCTFSASPDRKSTNFHQTAHFAANMSWLSGRAESYSLSSITVNSRRGLQAMDAIMARIAREGSKTLVDLLPTFDDDAQLTAH
jgi:hypothetical protein